MHKNVSAQLLLYGHVCSVDTVWICGYIVATVWTDFAGSKQFPLFTARFDTAASISTERLVIHYHFVVGLCGLWQLHYSLFAILTLGR